MTIETHSTLPSPEVTSPRFTQLDDWLGWMEQLHPKKIDMELTRVREVAQRLNIQRPAHGKIITVAGTNGKGSCVATLNQMLRRAGKTSGCYTSPHILRYNERIRLNDTFASDEDICRAFHAIDCARGEISLTYFEFGTLAALWLFDRAKLDYWLLEVGLGGRLDAVNLIDPDIAIITSIAKDHEAWLGDSLEGIAAEKAGILREGCVFINAVGDSLRSILVAAKALNTQHYMAGDQFNVTLEKGVYTFQFSDNAQQTFLVHVDEKKIQLPERSIAAALQALMLCGELAPLMLSQQDVPDAQKTTHDVTSSLEPLITQLSLVGRFERKCIAGKNYIFDVAHNPAAVEKLSQRLSKENIQPNVIILGMMADKNIEESLRYLCQLSPNTHWYPVSIHDNSRAATAEKLQTILQSLHVDDTCIHENNSVAEALLACESHSEQGEILIMGSFYTVGLAKEALNNDFS